MIKTIKTPSDNTFYTLIKEAKNSIYLCAPYIKKDIVDKILFHKKQGIEMIVITSSNISNFINGSLDASAIKELIKNDVVVRNYQKLHAKIYIFDKKKALITSANLTNNGLYNNFEYGVLIDDDTITDKVYEDYIQMINDDQCGTFNDALLNRVSKIKIKKKPIINIDNDHDAIIIENINNLIKTMTSWQKDVFLILNQMANEYFTTSDIYSYSNELKAKHPHNNHIIEKIRQILQQLRDMGFIKFLDRGTYKKLWIDKNKF